MKKVLLIFVSIALLSLVPNSLVLGRTVKIEAYFVRWMENFDYKLEKVESTIPYTRAVARAAIEKLLEGPTDTEMKRLSLSTVIPRGTKLNSIWIEEGVIYVDFSEELQNYTPGSANEVRAIWDQIVRTLKQFRTVRRIVITVEGKTELEGVLQP